MNEYAVLTALGKDRVGIVDDITNAILDAGCNLEESRMAVLGGEFAGILLVSGDGGSLESLLAQTGTIGESLGLKVEHKSTGPPAADPTARPYLIESVSLDTPGIVHAVTSLLRTHNINIEDLETETSAAPFTGAPMFLMKVRIAVPKGISLTRLREEIELLGSKQDLDIRLEPVASDH